MLEIDVIIQIYIYIYIAICIWYSYLICCHVAIRLYSTFYMQVLLNGAEKINFLGIRSFIFSYPKKSELRNLKTF